MDQIAEIDFHFELAVPSTSVAVVVSYMLHFVVEWAVVLWLVLLAAAVACCILYAYLQLEKKNIIL